MSETALLPDFYPELGIRLTPSEIDLVEANLLLHCSEAVSKAYRHLYKSYAKLLKSAQNMEFEMLEANFLRLVITDIISSGEYTLEGIAHVVRMPDDVIFEVASGLNENPSLALATRIIKLHSLVRKGWYSEIIKKALEVT